MKNHYFKNPLIVKLCTALLVGLSLFVINSCRKDSKINTPDITDIDLIQAKSWYDATYPPAGTTMVI